MEHKIKSIGNNLLRNTLLIIASWTLVLTTLLIIDLTLLKDTTRNLAMREAHAHFQKDKAFRLWAAAHGGFYVVTNERTPPNPYLAHIPDRDIETSSGKKLTLMNPAYALRQMFEEYEETYGVSVSVPLVSYLEEENKAALVHILSFIALWFLGLAAIIISYLINKKNIPERELAQKLLQESHNKLETLVIERTKDLQIEIENHKKVENALKVSEERYKGIIQSTASCIAVYKPTEDGENFIFIDFNPMAEKLENISKEDIIGKKVTEVFPGVKEFGLLKVFQDVNKSGIPQHFPISFYKGDKTEGYRENHVYQLSTGEIIAVYQDVSEEMLAKKELQIERDKLTSIFETMGDGIYIINKDFDLEYINSALRNEFGSIKGKKCYEYFHEKNEPCSFCNNKEVFAGNTVRWEWTSPKNNRTYDLIDSPLKNADGSISKLEIFRDITDRKRNELVQDVLYNISNAVITSDNLKNLIGKIRKELGKIIDTSNFYVALYNQKTDTFSFPFYTDEKDKYTTAPAEKTLTKYIIDTKKPLLATLDLKKEFEKKGILKHQGSLSKIWLGVPLIIDGEATGAFAIQSYKSETAFTESDMLMLELIAHQISISINRKKIEDDLIKALEKAEESDSLKSAFLANMSHEIRTPMNGILGFASLLKVPDLSGDQLNKYVDIIDKSGQRMLNIINDLIDLSKIEANQMDINISEFNLNDPIEYLYTFFSPEAIKANLDLNFIKPIPTTQVIIKTDKEKLFAILTNLLKNAIKYTHEGSIKFGYKIKGEMLEFYVEDTGIGIPDDRQHAVFERFIQADIEDRGVYEGAGLGLSITKAYVEMLGGDIWLKSKEGEGSQFYFTIPYKIKKEEILLPKEEEKIPLPKIEEEKQFVSPSKGLKILIAEDDESADALLTIILNDFSKSILHAKTGKETVDICRENPDLDLILMDIKMPNMDGYEATREIRKFNTNIIIIAQTSYALTGDSEKALAAGCDDYISKPINNELLLAKIENILL